MGKKYSFLSSKKAKLRSQRQKNTMVYLPKKKRKKEREKKNTKKKRKRNTKTLTGNMICMSMCIAVTKHILCNDTRFKKKQKNNFLDVSKNFFLL